MLEAQGSESKKILPDVRKKRSAPDVFHIKVSNHKFKNDNYLVVDPESRKAVLVDPAWELGKIEGLLASTHSSLSGILITHAHLDHTNLAKPLSERFNCPIWISERELTTSGFDAKHLKTIDETPWFVGNMCIEPILTPGHTPGSTCYRIGENLFTGDVLFAEGCGICADWSSAYAMYSSLELLKSVIAPGTYIFPGHTYVKPPGQRFSELLNYNIYLNFKDKDSFAAYRMRTGQNVKKLFDFR